MLALQPLQPHYLLCAFEVDLGLFRQSQVVRCMGGARSLQLLVGDERLQAVLTNRLVHQQAWIVCILLCLSE